MEKKTTLFSLYWAFVQIGALTFGGGYAMLPMLERECVDHHGWATKEELVDYYAISQCTPGIIAVNTATFIGSKYRGSLGAAAATLGVVTPSLVIILLIASILDQFAHYPAVIHAFAGVRVSVAVLIVNTVYRLFKSNVKGNIAVIIAVAAFLLVAILSLSPVLIVIAAAVVGIVAGRRQA